MTKAESIATEFAQTKWLISLIENALAPKTADVLKFKLHYQDRIRHIDSYYPFNLDQQALQLLLEHYKDRDQTLGKRLIEEITAEQKAKDDNSN